MCEVTAMLTEVESGQRVVEKMVTRADRVGRKAKLAIWRELGG